MPRISNGIIVNYSGTLKDLSGGTAIFTTLKFDGPEVASSDGVASATAVNPSSSEVISTGGAAIDTSQSFINEPFILLALPG
jgi:hypothetical protein